MVARAVIYPVALGLEGCEVVHPVKKIEDGPDFRSSHVVYPPRCLKLARVAAYEPFSHHANGL